MVRAYPGQEPDLTLPTPPITKSQSQFHTNTHNTMDVAYNRHSPSTRRSHPSLNHLSLAPLTPKFPITDPDQLPLSPTNSTASTTPRKQKTSYIEGRSAPTTPSILSRSSSRTRLRTNKSTHAFRDLTALSPAVPKSKSSVSITLTSCSTGRYNKPSSPTVGREDSEWLHRAGALIASSTRESKGQAWLATRNSSTSLVDAEEEEEGGGGDEGEVADDEFSPVSRRGSASRVGSKFASARSSRRGSRVGSRVGLFPTDDGRMPREYVGGQGAFMEGPDFVDGAEEDDGESGGEEVDEKELQRLTREKGFGLGGWVDNLIGWTLFRAEDDGKRDSEGELSDATAGQERLEPEGRRRREENERVVIAPAEEGSDVVPPPENAEGGWQDAAWLLSVASKLIL